MVPDENVTNRIRVDRAEWWQAIVVLCDKRLPLVLKKFRRTVVRSALLLNGSKCWAIMDRKRRMQAAEMRMLQYTSDEVSFRMIGLRIYCIRADVVAAVKDDGAPATVILPRDMRQDG